MTQQIRIGKVLLTKGGKWNAETLYPQLTFVIHNNDGWWSAHANIGSEPSADNHDWVQATDVRSLIEQVTTTLGSLDDFFEAVKVAENIRVEAEIGRVTAEAKRTKDETARQASEAQRIENESARQASETQREEAEALRAEAEDARVHEFDSLRAGIGSELELVKKAVDNADIKAQAAQKAINPDAVKFKTAEGKSVTVPVTGTICQWAENFTDYLRSAMSYTGKRTLTEFCGNVDFVVNSHGVSETVNK